MAVRFLEDAPTQTSPAAQPEQTSRRATGRVRFLDEGEGENQFFTEAQLEETPPNVSPLSKIQQLTLGFAVDDQARGQFLAEQFPGSQVALEPEKGFTIDGVRANPEGFDFGDILRNAGFALPIGGQIAGGLQGASIGAANPLAAVAGLLAGGVGGAVAGETVRQKIGEGLGVGGSGLDKGVASAREAGIALGGEVFGLGLGAAGRGIYKTIASAWSKVFKQAPKAAPDIVRFVGGVDPKFTKTAQKHGFDNTFQANNFDPQRPQQITAKTLFKRPKFKDIPIEVVGRPLPRLSGTQEGTIRLAQTIKEVDDDLFDDFISIIGGPSQDTARIIRTARPQELFSPQNLSESRPLELANNLLSTARKNQDVLGREVSKAENKALKAHGRETFQVTDLGSDLNNIIRRLGLASGIQVKGFERLQPVNVPGMAELMQLRRRLGSKVADSKSVDFGKFLFFGDKGTKGLSKRQATKNLKQMNAIADTVFSNKRIPDTIKREVAGFMHSFRQRYYQSLGIGDEALKFSQFKQFLDDANINQRNVLTMLENSIKNFDAQPEAVKRAFLEVTDAIPGNFSSRFMQKVNLSRAGSELRKMNARKVAETFEASIKNEGLLEATEDSIRETVFKKVDDVLRTKTPSRAFLNDAEKHLAARGFLKGSPNLLRIEAVLRLSGLSGVFGFVTGGPVGAFGGGLIGAIAGLSATKPQNVARALAAIERRSLQSRALAATAKVRSKVSGAGKLRGRLPKNQSSRLVGSALIRQLVQSQ